MIHRYALTRDEIRRAAVEGGVERQIQAIALELEDQNGFEGDTWGAHIEGAIGEYVVCARYFGREWVPNNLSFKRPDVGPYQVRCQKELIIRTGPDGERRPDRHGDDPRDVFIWVQPEGRRVYVVIGWIWGYEAPKFGRWHGFGKRPKAWFLKTVNPIETLPSEAEARAAKQRPSSNGQDTGLSSRERGVQLPPGAPAT
jgi:hypothetical protein